MNTNQTTLNNTAATPSISPEIIKELNTEINNMLSYAIHKGININTDINSLIKDNNNIDNLINMHNLLVKNIAPATPKSIDYLRETFKKGKEKSIFNQLPLLRNLILFTLFFVTCFIFTGISPEVNNDSLNKGIMNNNGISLLLNIGFLASVSGLGAMFYLLKNVSKSITKGTLLPEETISYIAQVILGIVSGLLISEVISFYPNDSAHKILFNKSVLALIGGFSSDTFFIILQGIIDKVKAIFTPNKYIDI